MRKLRNRVIPPLLGILSVLALLPTQALAAGTIDLNQNATFAVCYQHNGKPISDVPFDLYYVADVDAYAEQVWAGGCFAGRKEDVAVLHYAGPQIGVEGRGCGGERADPEHLADLCPIMEPAAAAARKAGCLLKACFSEEGILNWVRADEDMVVLNAGNFTK